MHGPKKDGAPAAQSDAGEARGIRKQAKADSLPLPGRTPPRIRTDPQNHGTGQEPNRCEAGCINVGMGKRRAAEQRIPRECSEGR
jgi:hypothetical protein